MLLFLTKLVIFRKQNNAIATVFYLKLLGYGILPNLTFDNTFYPFYAITKKFAFLQPVI